MMTPKTKRAAALGMLILPALTTLAAAQPPPNEASKWDADENAKGRYSMSPVDGGVMRLDRETGVLVICARVGNEIACKGVEDKTNVPQQDEVAALRQENKQLKQRIKDMLEDMESGEPPMGSHGYGPHARMHGDMHGDNMQGSSGSRFERPTEEQVDQALDYMTRVYKKIRDRVREIDKDQQASVQQPGSSQQQGGSSQSAPGPSQAPAAPSSQPSTPPAKLSP